MGIGNCEATRANPSALCIQMLQRAAETAQNLEKEASDRLAPFILSFPASDSCEATKDDQWPDFFTEVRQLVKKIDSAHEGLTRTLRASGF